MISNWTWNFKELDLIYLYGKDPTYIFEDPGVFVVELTVTDSEDNWNIDTMIVTVRDGTKPTAEAGEDRDVPVGSEVILDASLSSDNDLIQDHSWFFTYRGEERNIRGEKASHTFEEAGVYEITLIVTDRAGNIDQDVITINVVDTGRVTGTVLYDNGYPVYGAGVWITGSDGRTYLTGTDPNGIFSIDVIEGNFNWRITLEGYVPISGTSSVKAMEETELDLSETPLKKESEEGPGISIPLIITLIMVILVVIGLSVHFITGNRRNATYGIRHEE